MPAASNEPLLNTEKKYGFVVGEEVVFEGKGKVVGFSDQRVKVKIGEGSQAVETEILPKYLGKAKVGPIMKCVLQSFCGYMDIWFLRETFKGSFQDWKEKKAAELVEKQAEWLFHELDMDAWDPEKINPLVHWTFGLYLRKILAPSVYYYKSAARKVHILLGVTLVFLIFWTGWSFVNADYDLSDDEATKRGVQAFEAVEDAPVTPLILALCTHLIMMIFAGKQLQELFSEGSTHLPFPLTYTIIVGKLFMVLRMVMAYSSKNLGLSIDYFVWQELILIIMHAVLSVFVGDPAPRPHGPSYAKQLSKTYLLIFGIDSLKTVVMFVFFCTFKEGAISYYFNRLPSTSSMLSASILIHGVLDVLQTATTMFTMFIGRIFIAYTTDQSDHEWTEAKKQQEEVPALAKQLEGRWQKATKYFPREIFFEIHHWKIQVPDRLDSTRIYQFPTVYEFYIPQTFIRVKVPPGMQAGDILSVTELRRIDHYSYYSFNVDVLKELPSGYLPYEMFGCDLAKMQGDGSQVTCEYTFGSFKYRKVDPASHPIQVMDRFYSTNSANSANPT